MDLNETAFAVVQKATADADEEPKDARFVQSGRRGGQARAARMTAKQRSEAARKAVNARWARAANN